jgi:YidC/Oxa1 family membrane protein insertase
MFDALFEAIAKTLSVFYDLIPNYAFAIAMLTLAVMVVTTPFTLKGTRSMIQMQRLQPEMRRLQVKHKDDRQKLNEELMAFYKENNLNPLGGCLPLLLQAPIFFILFRVVRGLVNEPHGRGFEPKYLSKTSDMYQSLFHHHHMVSFGIDLSQSASAALKVSFAHGLPQLILVAVVAVTSYYQQKQIQGRNPNAEIPPQQKMLMRLMPAMFVVFAFVSAGALVIYFVVSNLYRILMQAYITRTLYHGEDSLGAQAQRAAVETKKLKEEHGAPQVMPRIGKRKDVIDTRAETTPAKATPTPPSPAAASNGNKVTSGSGANGAGPTPPRPRTGASNRSKKKRKRR